MDAFVRVESDTGLDGSAIVTPDAQSDAAADAGSDARAPGPDASFPGTVRWVVNTLASGPGSFVDAVATVNATCSLEPQAIFFDIPEADPGVVTVGAQRFWRITPAATQSLTCAGTLVDGTTQTLLRGDTNPAVFGGMPVGAASARLPPIYAPEIEIRGVGIAVGAPDVKVRGLAMEGFSTAHPRTTLEQCLVGSEPYAVEPLPMALIESSNMFYASNCADTLVRECVFVAHAVPPGYSGFSFRGGCDRATVRDSYFTGTGPGDFWDELHLNPADDHRVVHNYLGGAGWEVHVEWVPGSGGIVSDNTFVGAIPEISMGGAATMTGNITVP